MDDACQEAMLVDFFSSVNFGNCSLNPLITYLAFLRLTVSNCFILAT